MKKLILLVSAILVLASGCNSFFAKKVQPTPKPQQPTISTPVSQQNPVSTPVVPITQPQQPQTAVVSHVPTIPLGWGTHQDYNLNFQISYPTDWNFEDDSNFFPPGKNFDTTTGYVGDMVLDTVDNPNQEDLQTFYKNINQSKGAVDLFANSASQIALVVNGFPAEKFTGVHGEVPSDEYAVNLGSTIVELTIYVPHDTDGITSGMVNSISTPTPVTWKTYTNSQYHFELQYPEVIPQHPMQVSINPNTNPGIVEIDFNYWDGNENAGGFSLFIQPNPSGDTLTQWFEQNEDINGDLLNAGNLKIVNISGGQEAYTVGPLPQSYTDAYAAGGGGPVDALSYFMPNSKTNVFLLNLSQDGGVDAQDFIDKVAESIKFTQ